MTESGPGWAVLRIDGNDLDVVFDGRLVLASGGAILRKLVDLVDIAEIAAVNRCLDAIKIGYGTIILVICLLVWTFTLVGVSFSGLCHILIALWKHILSILLLVIELLTEVLCDLWVVLLLLVVRFKLIELTLVSRLGGLVVLGVLLLLQLLKLLHQDLRWQLVHQLFRLFVLFIWLAFSLRCLGILAILLLQLSLGVLSCSALLLKLRLNGAQLNLWVLPLL